ncbi:hypothetical protein N781_04825 [Pontibacillus halophilus JSM 076056 = DSM 19796]|uniref:Inner-membrane translocator n=1 Tax=Pontibacillus halophilus JSM 076056 = DSM 19796 TaxID=1385510 RepID=A0A0A5GDY4_9BACI|nr:hypothetical protein [Pontibacillus halophilus]KGX91416.1 hypothetical protein N781_04825 [Pontibacillus halophilus JSM 076056 = DSM 19796]
MVLVVLLALLVTIDGLAVHFYKRNKVELWVYGILMMVLAPIVAFLMGYLFLELSRATNPESTHEGAGYAGAFIFLCLLANAIVLCLTGILLRVFGKKRT